MNRLFLHVGMPKTGTTSIQDSLFWSDLKEPYRFLSLDTNFANRTANLAYQNPERHRGNFFVETLSSKQFTRYGRFSKKYIQNALSRCAQQRLTPIISAETLWGMRGEELEGLRKDAITYGFTPQIICYLRSPIDYSRSLFQQGVRTGVVKSIENVLSLALRLPRGIKLLDDAFGSDNVRLYIFDPGTFPGNCVVKHFCTEIGLDWSQLTLIRENESMNINRLKFLYAWNTCNVKNPFSLSTRLKRRLVLDSLQGLSGPSLRFHPNLTKNMLVEFESQREFLEKRIGRSVPLSLSQPEQLEGIKQRDELLDFSAESLDWLWSGSHARPRATRPTNLRCQAVVERLNRMHRSYCISRTSRYLSDEIKRHLRRRKLIRMNLAKN
jgi:hypothetical protein